MKTKYILHHVNGITFIEYIPREILEAVMQVCKI